MILILLLWFFLIIYGIHYDKSCESKPFGFQNSIALRGICAVEIMIGHLGLPTATNSIFLYPNRKSGILFVGMFFALSGYGLMYSFKNKKGYMQHFLPKRIFKILLPAYLVYIIGLLVEGWAGLEEGIISQIWNMENFFRATNWYVWELILLYIFFYICFKYVRAPWQMISLFAFLVGFVVIAFILKIDDPWYGSTLCFGLGLLYAEQDKVMVDKLKLLSYRCIIVLGGVVALSIGLFYILGEKSMIGNLIARNIASVSFVLVSIGLLYRLNIGNPISVFLGKYSYEIFLFHPLFIRVLRPYIVNNLVYSILVIICTIVAAYIFKKLWIFITNRRYCSDMAQP